MVLARDHLPPGNLNVGRLIALHPFGEPYEVPYGRVHGVAHDVGQGVRVRGPDLEDGLPANEDVEEGAERLAGMRSGRGPERDPGPAPPDGPGRVRDDEGGDGPPFSRLYSGVLHSVVGGDSLARLPELTLHKVAPSLDIRVGWIQVGVEAPAVLIPVPAEGPQSGVRIELEAGDVEPSGALRKTVGADESDRNGVAGNIDAPADGPEVG